MKPLWLKVAERELGIHETAGPASTQRIVQYNATTSLKATSDEIGWCSSFANWCLLKAGIVGTGSAAAKSWLDWGISGGPAMGAITVIRKRQSGPDSATGSGSGYHVGFWISQTDTHVNLLGGNQHDSVKISQFPISQYEVLAYRWPK